MRLDFSPERPVSEAITENLREVIHHGIDSMIVKLYALDCIFLTATPVALFEAPRRALRNAPKIVVVPVERINNEPRTLLCEAVRRGLSCSAVQDGHCMLAIMASPNSLHLTSVAPSMRRAKS